jgi:hypothetical protein
MTSRFQSATGRCKACGDHATCWVPRVTYSFGIEWWRLCDWCSGIASGPGQCERCKQEVDELIPSYDWEEHGGFGPRVYWICPECARKEGESFDAASADEELATYREKEHHHG